MTQEQYLVKIRIRLKDQIALNRLLGTYESDESQIIEAISTALDDFNQRIPTTNYTLVNFPKTEILIRSAIVELLISQGILFSRNILPYNDGSLTINDMEGKDQKYVQWISIFAQKVERQIDNWKVQLNLAKFTGGISSPYKSLTSLDVD